MEAKELLQLYAEGRRDFQEVNLYGADLREAELVGANLTRAELYQANFSGANLSEANLCDANLGTANLSGANLSNANLSTAYLWGVNLSSANLWGANLSDAHLWEANLSNANLNTASLSGANLGKANLSSAQLVKADLSFAELNFADLSFANLVAANLIGANLRETNLNQANLKQANVSGSDISGAKLLQSRLLSTNFEDATLTGACIEDWHINAQTNFSNVICNYIYLKCDNQERRPHDLNKNFEPEEFSKLVEHSLETVDLIFTNGIDWKAFFSSFVELQSEARKEISIRAIEKKSDGAFVIRVDVPTPIDKAEIERSFQRKYQRKLTAVKKEYKSKFQAKEEEIDKLLEQNTNLTYTVKNLAEKKPNIGNINIFEGNLNMTENQNPTIYNQNGPMGIGHMSSGEIKDNAKVAGIINEAEQQNLADAVMQVQQILQQLSQSYPTETMSERIAIANEAIKQIEANPTIKQRLINAATEGGLAVIEKAFDNPIGALFVGVIKGWKEAE